MTFEATSDIRRKLEAELRAGERLVWSEQPDPAVHVRLARSTFVFGILWCVFIGAFSVVVLLVPGEGRIIGGLFMIPFWLAGVGMLRARARARKRAAQTIYGVTESRALILTTGKALEVRSFYVNDLGKVKRVERPDGSGDLILRQDLKSDNDGGTTAETGFIGIKDVRRVERLVAEVRDRR